MSKYFTCLGWQKKNCPFSSITIELSPFWHRLSWLAAAGVGFTCGRWGQFVTHCSDAVMCSTRRILLVFLLRLIGRRCRMRCMKFRRLVNRISDARSCSFGLGAEFAVHVQQHLFQSRSALIQTTHNYHYGTRTLKVGFHYPSSRAELTGRVDGPSWQVSKNAPSSRTVNSARELG